MDTITHGIIGALIGKAFFAEEPPRMGGPSWWEAPVKAGRVAILSSTIGSVFPDIDVFAGPLARNSLALLTWHRGITHSLIMLPVWAAVLASLTAWLARRLRWPAPAFATLFTIYGVALASHIFLDLLTSFGTMVWSPVDHTRMAWDTVFIVDLTVTSVALVPQLVAWVYRRPDGAWRRAVPFWLVLSGAAFAIGPWVRSQDVPFPASASAGVALIFAVCFFSPLRRQGRSRLGRKTWCRGGVGILAGYLCLAAGMHHLAIQEMRQFATDGHFDYQNLAALPMPAWPARWAGLMATPEGVYRVQFNLTGTEDVRINFFRNAEPNRYIDEARQLRDVQTFLWFSRFPVFSYLERNGQPVVQISDVRFVMRPTTDLEGAIPSNFIFEVVFTPDGRVVSAGRSQAN